MPSCSPAPNNHVPSALQGASIEQAALRACHSWTKPQRLAATCARNHSCSRRHLSGASKTRWRRESVRSSHRIVGRDSQNKNAPAQKNAWIALSAGGVGVHRVLLHLRAMEYLKRAPELSHRQGRAAAAFTGIASGLRYTIQQKGFFSLYTGLTPVLIFSAPKAGVRFEAPILSEPVGR